MAEAKGPIPLDGDDGDGVSQPETAPRHAPPTTHAPPKPGAGPRQQSSGLDTYNTVADTVGMVPNIRWKDSLFQLVFIVVFVVIGVGVTLAAGWPAAAGRTMHILVGAVLGFIIGGVLSGAVLMVVGWVRTLSK